jgi:hypothetical protein
LFRKSTCSLGKSSPTTPTSLTGLKKPAATEEYTAAPPKALSTSPEGVLTESNATLPTINRLLSQQEQPITYKQPHPSSTIIYKQLSTNYHTRMSPPIHTLDIGTK